MIRLVGQKLLKRRNTEKHREKRKTELTGQVDIDTDSDREIHR